MGNSEVGHLNLGAGRPVLQDLPRIDAAIADGSLLPERGAARRPSGARPSRAVACTWSASSGPAASTRSTATPSPSPSWRAQEGARDVVVHAPARRPRHAAALGGRLRAGLRGAPRRRAPGRAHRHDRRPLLRHGPRQALGARRARYYEAIVHGRGPASRQPRIEAVLDGLRPRRERRVREADRHRRRRRHRPRRRRGHPLQLPGRPRAPADPRPRRRRRLRRLRPRAPAARPAGGHDDRVRERRCPSRSPSRRWS